MSTFYDHITAIITAIDHLAETHMVTMSTSSSIALREMRQELYKIQSTAVS